MRDILFRGKRADNGDWHEGEDIMRNTIRGKVCLAKIGEDWISVDPKTVGQYTGFKDKNGTKIFDGDILRDDDNEENGVVEFIDGEFCVVFGNVETHGIYDIACCCYVIGNIYDNPELEVTND